MFLINTVAWGGKNVGLCNTRDHDPRRADQCNLHTHVIANKNKSPVEKVCACTDAGDDGGHGGDGGDGGDFGDVWFRIMKT